MLKRDSGQAELAGQLTGEGLYLDDDTGGKRRAGRPLPGALLQARQALLEEALAPLADDLPWRVQACGDLVVAQSLCGIQHDLGSDDVTIR